MAADLEKPSPGGSRLSGKVAVVTGGNRGIGFAMARALASEACNLVICGRHQEKLEQAAARLRQQLSDNVRTLAVVCDVRELQSVEKMFAEVGKEFGQLDILVNNAGISQAAAPVEQTDVDLWREIIDTNLTGMFLCTRAALPLMTRGGTILNVISVAARDSFAGYAPYNASKAGALSFTRTLRQELMERGIRVTALLPGATSTDIWQQVMPGAPRQKMMQAESVAAFVLQAALLSPKANLTELVLDPTEGAM
jgi:NAD(P)-dependent dehydrogenase (short-subunit alcohol dehydrogenase family)